MRADLAPGAQLAQSCHALSAFATTHPDSHWAWHTEGKNLVCLQSPSEVELESLLRRAQDLDLNAAGFYEPDFDGELTAIAIDGRCSKLVSTLPLALRAERAAACL